ncbi:Thiol-disulfide isomerase or thioredoxin [Pseudoxanthomonas sp. GM95]|uniref:redoxin family protein n=1 Tax=Pseudoxanthomonas sp. GM95 TaxID=1881043 RepID=UPI0008CF1826|nr:redoxin family protein [Pseudoxanthomonas sp. GM95]SEL49936.1 Thiol-disulfide isomerase or thioredoxin [Pseudoxanthomonas sp. GM95]
MTSGNTRLLLVALAAGVLGIGAGLWSQGSWHRTEAGQQVLQRALDAQAPAPPAGVTPAAPGDPMPPIRLPDLDGNVVELAALAKGRPLLVNVWASWCGPCIQEMPELDRFAAAQGEHGVQVVGLALDTREGVQGFLQQVPVRYPLLLESPGPADASVWLGNRAGVLPYSVLIGADGRVLKQQVGPFAHGEIDHWAADAAARAGKIQTRD